MDITANKWLRRILPLVIPVFALLLWEILCDTGVISPTTLPAPTNVIKTGITMIGTGELTSSLMISLFRALAGFLIGGTIGFLLGVLNGFFNLSNLLFDSSVQMIRNIPHLALIPLIILWLGIGESSKIVLVALGSLFPIYINTYHGIRSVDKDLVEMGRSYGLNGLSLFAKVIFPGALSSILVGVRYALGVMWTTLIVAETIASNSGIGYLSMNAREFMQLNVIILCILIYAVLGKVSDLIAKFFENKWLRWSRT
jgi:ABC-type nitrate/sulfonate/bicarbonate transport system, permease component